ncbi:hypothetical protein Rhopal_001377-T1 [Rhodotorula paludigena]|uniref:RRM domain-containing protein n=1 Tax=Rhodotorula paludigena TaxID=86838 RepID=A0AAV5G781_9BASI|nr:hypothetical protein Rhopal_001377-T1 [Rhodotorula paludigena]
METGSHDAPVETLPDPTTLTPQERVDRLVEAVESDDLLGVVLFLKFLEEGEVNARSHGGAQHTAQAQADEISLRIVHEWDDGGSAAAQNAYRLVHEMELSEADTWICDHAPPAAQPERDSLSATIKAETPEPPVPPTVDTPEPALASRESRASSAAPSMGRLALRHLPSTTTTSDIRQLAISRGLFFRKVSIQESSTLHEVDALVDVDSAEGVQRTVAALEGALLGETVLRLDGPAALCAGSHLQDDSQPEQRAAVAAEPSSAPEAKPLIEAPDAAPPTTSSRAADPSKQNATSSSNSRAISPAARRGVHAARRTPSPAERRRPQPPRRPLRWAYLSELPLSISERYLFDQLGKQSIVAHDVIVIQRSDKPRRFAFVALTSDVDMRHAIDLFDRRWMDHCMVLAVPYRDKRTGANEPDTSRLPGVYHSLRQPYAGSRANAAQEPHPAACKVVIAHLDARATKNDVGDFIERYVGRDSVRTLRLDYDGHNNIEQIAYVEFSRHLDALRAFHGLDGAILFDHACTVNWIPDASNSAGFRTQTFPLSLAFALTPAPRTVAAEACAVCRTRWHGLE